MNTYKVKATMIIDVEVDVDAENEEQAISKFIQMDARDAIDEGTIQDVNTENETATLIDGEFNIKTTAIDYDILDVDVWDDVVNENPDVEEESDEFYDLIDAKMKELKEKLPQQLELKVTCNPKDLDDYVVDAVTEETGWLVNSVEYEIQPKN